MTKKQVAALQHGSRFFSFAPASVANVGPCFDIMGYCLDYVGDFAEIEITSEAGILRWAGVTGPYSTELATCQAADNAAYAVAEGIWSDPQLRTSRFDSIGIKLTLHKYMPIASGLGSSAASGVAAGKLLVELMGLRFDHSNLVEEYGIFNYLLRSEGQTAHARHPDNVLPSYLGGFLIMGNHQARKVVCPRGLISVIIKPNVQIITSAAREKLRDYIVQVTLGSRSKKEQAYEVLHLMNKQSHLAASLATAVHEGDLKSFGEVLHRNDLLEGARAELIPNFYRIKEAAVEVGAYGCSISGSGPSIVAITDDVKKAQDIRDAMVLASESSPCFWLISPANDTGARILSHNISDELKKGRGMHNFFTVP